MIAVTSAQLAELRQFGFAPRRTVVIPNGVPGPAASGVPRQQLRAELGLPVDAFLVVMVARLMPAKRVEDFLAALSALRESTPAALGIVVGVVRSKTICGAMRSSAVPQCGSSAFTRPTKYMLAADVVCLTSEFEALPMALIESGSLRPRLRRDPGAAAATRSSTTASVDSLWSRARLMPSLLLWQRSHRIVPFATKWAGKRWGGGGAYSLSRRWSTGISIC